MEKSLVLRVLYLERDPHPRVLGKFVLDSQEQDYYEFYTLQLVFLNVFYWKVVPILFHNKVIL